MADDDDMDRIKKLVSEMFTNEDSANELLGIVLRLKGEVTDAQDDLVQTLRGIISTQQKHILSLEQGRFTTAQGLYSCFKIAELLVYKLLNKQTEMGEAIEILTKTSKIADGVMDEITNAAPTPEA